MSLRRSPYLLQHKYNWRNRRFSWAYMSQSILVNLCRTCSDRKTAWIKKKMSKSDTCTSITDFCAVKGCAHMSGFPQPIQKFARKSIIGVSISLIFLSHIFPFDICGSLTLQTWVNVVCNHLYRVEQVQPTPPPCMSSPAPPLTGSPAHRSRWRWCCHAVPGSPHFPLVHHTLLPLGIYCRVLFMNYVIIFRTLLVWFMNRSFIIK